MTDEKLTDVFGALSDVRRLRALRFVSAHDPSSPGADGSEGDAVCACHVQDHLGLSQPATSYHMKILTEAGLVTAEKRGRWVHYRIAPEGIAAVRAFLDDLEETAPAVAGAA